MTVNEITIPLELEMLVGENVKEATAKLMKVVAEQVKNLTWQVANDYIENYADFEPVSNFTYKVQREVERCAPLWSVDPGDVKGRNIRDSIFTDHKEEIVKLITQDLIDQVNRDCKHKLETTHSRCRYLEGRVDELLDQVSVLEGKLYLAEANKE